MANDAVALERREDGFLHHFVDVGEVRLHVAEARPEGIAEASDVPSSVPLVVFLHGFPEFWWTWRHQLRAMAQAGFWAVAPDLRGYNESDKPKGVSAYEIEKLASDVAGLVRALGRESAIIIGHDWGGMVAWNVANEFPEVVQKLAILNVPHPLVMTRNLLRNPAQMRRSWYIFVFQLPFLPERLIAKDDYAIIRRLFLRDAIPPDDVERYIDALRVPGAVPAALAYYRASVRRVASRSTPKTNVIDQPVLVIWGDQDRVLGSDMAEPPRRFVPNARVVHIPNASHWVQVNAAEQVSDLLVGFARAK